MLLHYVKDIYCEFRVINNCLHGVNNIIFHVSNLKKFILLKILAFYLNIKRNFSKFCPIANCLLRANNINSRVNNIKKILFLKLFYLFLLLLYFQTSLDKLSFICNCLFGLNSVNN